MRGKKIKIAVSMGDPAGVGAEIILKSASKLPPNVQLTVFGDKGVINSALKILEIRSQKVFNSSLNLVEVTKLPNPEALFGKPSKVTGESAYQYLLCAVEAVMKGSADALVTAPLSKQWVMATRKNFIGHTELLAKLSKAKKVAMMFCAPTMRVALVTTHLPLADVPKILTAKRIVDVILLVHDALVSWFGISCPRIAVAGLNPHAGEGGTLGAEETKVITPALEEARKKDINVIGPIPADAMFAIREQFDAMVCMYHDQALAPLKALHFHSAVNLTLGLPFVRTSPDHGTAFDIGGKGVARYESMLSAIKLACEIVKQQRKNERRRNEL